MKGYSRYWCDALVRSGKTTDWSWVHGAKGGEGVVSHGGYPTPRVTLLIILGMH